MANTKKKMAPDGSTKKRQVVDDDDVEGHGSSIKKMAPEGANKKMGPEGGVSGSSKRSAVDDDDVEGHMIGTMSPVLARDLARAKEQDVQRSASRGNLISEAKRAIRRKD